MHYAYPVTVEPEPRGYTLFFEGLPGATWGETPEEAVAKAKELLMTALEMLIEDGEDIPPAPPSAGRLIIEAEVPARQPQAA